jgi:hypothetical protein
MGPEGRSFFVHWISKIKALWYDDFARRLNFGVREASGSARVAIELRIDSGGSSELLAINRQDETDGKIYRVGNL